MTRPCRHRSRLQCLLVASLAWVGLAAPAQDAVAPTDGHASMESAMPGMAMPPADTAPAPARATSATAPAKDMAIVDHASMPGMNHGEAHEGHRPPPTAAPTAAGDPRALEIHGSGSPGARRDSAHRAAMDMRDDVPIGMLLIDRLETYQDGNGNGQRWDVEGHYGNDENKLWLRTEGERSGGRTDVASVEVFWNRAVAPFWATQTGVRADVGAGPDRHWAAFGIQGIAPFGFALEATGYVGSAGRTAARLRVQYELPLTQRLILQPELEANAYGQADPPRRSGSGIADRALGLRLRYEFQRQVAPYVGIVWTQRFGRTADFAREDGRPARDRQWVAGIRLWF